MKAAFQMDYRKIVGIYLSKTMHGAMKECIENFCWFYVVIKSKDNYEFLLKMKKKRKKRYVFSNIFLKIGRFSILNLLMCITSSKLFYFTQVEMQIFKNEGNKTRIQQYVIIEFFVFPYFFVFIVTLKFWLCLLQHIICIHVQNFTVWMFYLVICIKKK